MYMLDSAAQKQRKEIISALSAINVAIKYIRSDIRSMMENFYDKVGFAFGGLRTFNEDPVRST